MQKASSHCYFCSFRTFTPQRLRFNSQTLWLQVADAEQSVLGFTVCVATIPEGDKGFSSGKSEAKRGPMCRMLPFKPGMQQVTSGWQRLSEGQWKNCHVHFKKHQAMIQKLIALQYTAQNKVFIFEAVTPGNTIEYEYFYFSVDFIHFTWIKW